MNPLILPKKKTFNCVLVLLLSLGITTLQAATVTWIGASGSWSNGANWDNGIGITAVDEAIIPTGVAVTITAGVNAFATKVDLAAGSDLIISTTGSLNVANAINTMAMDIGGRFLIRGTLNIDNITNPLNVFLGGIGINLTGKMGIKPSAIVNITNIDAEGIRIDSASSFYNSGTMVFDEIGDYAMLNYGLARNYSDINVTNLPTTGATGLLNFGEFRNYANGVITIDGGAATGFGNNGLSAVLKNWGSIEVNDAGTNGFNNNGITNNIEGGSIHVNRSGGTGVYNGASGTVNNYGEIYSEDAGFCGVINLGDIFTYDLLFIADAANYGMRTYTGSTLTNEYRLYITGNLYSSLQHEGTLTNEDGGYFISDDQLNIVGTLTNNGIMVSEYTGWHWKSAAGIFDNFGAMDDRHASFGTVNNQQVIVEPITGVMQNAIPFPDALNVTSLADVTILGWFMDALATTSAGTYDSVTNEFTPNATSIGATELWVVVKINSSLIERSCRVIISAPILPMVGFGGSQNEIPGFQGTLDLELAQDIGINVFPNPTTQEVQLNSELFAQAETQVLIFNSLGQLVMERHFSESPKLNLNMGAQLVNGIYFIHCLQGENLIANERIQLQRY